MSVDEILEQVMALSIEERKELAKRLIDVMDAPAPVPTTESGEHWGKNLIRLLDEIGPIELIHPEIEDPVEWVNKIREEQRRRRLGDWGEDE
jgi:hypothetical protein